VGPRRRVLYAGQEGARFDPHGSYTRQGQGIGRLLIGEAVKQVKAWPVDALRMGRVR